MRVLYIPIPEIMHPWYDDFLRAIGDRHEVRLYDFSRPINEQFKGIGAVVELGGSLQTREMVDTALAEGVRLWQISGAGLNQLAAGVAYFLEKGMPLAHTPGPFSGIALAEHALFLMLLFAKNFAAGQRSLRAKILCQPLNHELWGKTLGLVGLGASGRELAKRAWAMGMRVMAIEKEEVPPATLKELHIDYVGAPSRLSEVLREADYLSLHVPLTSETRHMIDRRVFERMKPTAVLINVARGEIVDESALTEALQSRRIAGAGLDVFAVEPVDPEHPLLRLENVIATPHVAGVTSGTSRRRGQALADNVDRVAKGLPPLYQVKSIEKGEPRYEVR